ncbi:MAG TPA: HAD family hydrolase [Candidatus Krumholzibacteriaceae bacterium]|nr:HAD family hydrolase [Candidatus Krumholzibacteriaceae bacterium]
MTIKAVVFDLDGTLVKFNLDYKTVRAETKQILVKEGFPASIFSLDESIFDMLQKAQLYMKNNGKKETEIAKVKEAIFKLAERHELEAARTTELLPGASETLKLLEKMKLKLGLFTINCTTATDYMLEQLQLARFFKAIATRDCVQTVKPAPEHLTIVLKKLNAKPEETLVVGDGISDMKSAQELKAKGIGIPTGVATREALTRAGATCLITSLTDLPTLVNQLNQETQVQPRSKA